MPDEKLLDARDMEPPEPFESAVAVLSTLKQRQYLRMLLRRIPYPLLDYCKVRGLKYRVQRDETATYEILVWHPEDTDIIAHLFKGDSLCA